MTIWSALSQLPGAPFITASATIIAAIIGLKKASTAASNTNVGSGNVIVVVSNGGQAVVAFLLAAVFLASTWQLATSRSTQIGAPVPANPTSSQTPSTSESWPASTGSKESSTEVAQNFLNSYYAGYRRYTLGDENFDRQYFHFPLRWYNADYDYVEQLAGPKQAHNTRAAAKGWRACDYYAAQVQEATRSDQGNLTVVATVKKEPESGCSAASSTTIVEYLLVPDGSASPGLKIASVKDVPA